MLLEQPIDKMSEILLTPDIETQMYLGAMSEVTDYIYDHSKDDDYMELTNELDLIHSLVKKSVPIQPQEKNKSYYCPRCESLLITEDDEAVYDCDEYCGYCGQHVNWSGIKGRK